MSETHTGEPKSLLSFPKFLFLAAFPLGFWHSGLWKLMKNVSPRPGPTLPHLPPHLQTRKMTQRVPAEDPGEGAVPPMGPPGHPAATPEGGKGARTGTPWSRDDETWRPGAAIWPRRAESWCTRVTANFAFRLHSIHGCNIEVFNPESCQEKHNSVVFLLTTLWIKNFNIASMD